MYIIMHHPACSLFFVFSLSLSLFLPLGKGLRADPCPGTSFLLCGGIARSLSLSLACLLACKACGLEAETETPRTLRRSATLGVRVRLALSLSLFPSLSFARIRGGGETLPLHSRHPPYCPPPSLSILSLFALLGVLDGGNPSAQRSSPYPGQHFVGQARTLQKHAPPRFEGVPLLSRGLSGLYPSLQQLNNCRQYNPPIPGPLSSSLSLSLFLPLSLSLSLSTLSLLQHRQRAIRSSERPWSSHLVLPPEGPFSCANTAWFQVP